MAKISLVGGSGRRGRGSQPIEFKIEALRLICKEGLSAKEAISRAADEHGVDLEGKSSYENHPGSHKHRYVKEVHAAQETDESVRLLCEEAGLEFQVQE